MRLSTSIHPLTHRLAASAPWLAASAAWRSSASCGSYLAANAAACDARLADASDSCERAEEAAASAMLARTSASVTAPCRNSRQVQRQLA